MDAWRLYHSMFKDGDPVLVITEDDELFYGNIMAHPLHCVLSRRGVKTRRIPWEDVRFIAHDGFPVKKLTGADEKIQDAVAGKEVERAMRWLFAQDGLHECVRCGMFRHIKAKKHCYPCHKAVFGDPFLIEDFTCTLLNPGNRVPSRDEVPHMGFHDWQRLCDSLWDYEEVLVLEHRNGAQGLLYDLSTCYHIEVPDVTIQV